jgi:hypothetical protein
MRRIEENGTYINLVRPDCTASGRTPPWEVSPCKAKKLTLFMYEEILASGAATDGTLEGVIERVFTETAWN